MARIYGRCTEQQLRAMETEFALTSWRMVPRSTFLCRSCGASSSCFYISETYPICFDCVSNLHTAERLNDAAETHASLLAKPNKLGLTVQVPYLEKIGACEDDDFSLV